MTTKKCKIGALCLIWIFSSSCSLLFVKSQKEHGMDCSSNALNYAIPVAGSLSTLASLTMTLMVTADGLGGPKLPVQMTSIGLTSLGLFSAIYGFATISQCRSWKAEQEATSATNLRLNTCGAPYPGLQPGLTFAPQSEQNTATGHPLVPHTY